MNPEARATAELAFDHLCTAGETGDWQPLLEMLSDEFEFLFPAGALRGKHTGLEGKGKFLQWVQKRASSRSRKTTDLKLFSEDWAVFCVDVIGDDSLGYFETHVALFFRVNGGRVVAYREYIGDISAWI